MRTVTPDDADELAELDALLFPDNCFNEVTLAKEIELGIGWVAIIRGKIVGYTLVRDDSLILDVTRLGVHPKHQGRGIGTMLMTRVLKLGRPTMLTVNVKNEGALRLYRRCGFEVTGLLDRSAWVMQLRTSS